MSSRTLDLRKVFGMIVTYDQGQALEAPNSPFDVITELYPGGESAIHIHPQQDEVYEVKEGVLEVYMGGQWKALSAGESITIPKGTVHGFRNKTGAMAVAFNRHSPGLRFGAMLETINTHITTGRIADTKGFKSLAYMSLIMLEYKEVMHPIKPPVTLLKWMARLGKAFGYKLELHSAANSHSSRT